MLGNIIAAGANLLGGILGNNKEEKMAKQNIKMQKEFAQHGVRWKVEDAKAAGLHPLAALGAQTSSFSPVSVGSDLATGISAAGQDIGRAVNATRTAGERVDAYTKTVQDLSIQRMGLENQLLASQIAKVNQAGSPPAFPTAGNPYLIEGQAGSGLVADEALKRISSAPTSPSQEAGAVTELGYLRTPNGYAPAMSKDAKDRLEEDTLGVLAWNLRNRLAPSLGFNENPPAIQQQDGYYVYNPFTQEYQLVRHDRPRYGFRNYYR